MKLLCRLAIVSLLNECVDDEWFTVENIMDMYAVFRIKPDTIRTAEIRSTIREFHNIHRAMVPLDTNELMWCLRVNDL